MGLCLRRNRHKAFGMTDRPPQGQPRWSYTDKETPFGLSPSIRGEKAIEGGAPLAVFRKGPG